MTSYQYIFRNGLVASLNAKIIDRPPQYQVGQAFQPDVRLESLTYDAFDILAGG